MKEEGTRNERTFVALPKKKHDKIAIADTRYKNHTEIHFHQNSNENFLANVLETELNRHFPAAMVRFRVLALIFD